MANHNENKTPGKRRRAAVVGMFDGVHKGHIFLLDSLQKEAAVRNLSPTVFTFPAHPLSVVNPARAPKLLTTPAEKLEKLRSVGIATENIGFLVFNESLRRMNASDFMEMLHNRYDVDFILRGFNNRFGTERDLTHEDYRLTALRHGIELIDAAPLAADETLDSPPVSSSRIRAALSSGNITEANLMAGYRYELSGLVIDGKKLGRKLGFPTANLRQPNPDKLIPGNGVYICSASFDGHTPYRAIVNIGIRPTVDGNNSRQSIEAHLLDFDADIYGKTLTLQFITRMREEIRFPSTRQLIKQLESDRETARNYPII